MNRNDLLYNAINNYFAIQTMNSFCIEAILEADLKDAQKQPLDMYSKMIPLFGFDSENIKEFCENAKLLSKLNIKRKVFEMNDFSKYEIFEAAVKATKDMSLTLKEVEVQLKKLGFKANVETFSNSTK